MANKKKRKHGWHAPENAADYFDPHYDDDFKAKHPVLYWLTVAAIILLVVSGPFLYLAAIAVFFPEAVDDLPLFAIFGAIASFGISIGFTNLFMLLHGQYLGHKVTLYSFAIGLGGCGLSLLLIWVF